MKASLQTVSKVAADPKALAWYDGCVDHYKGHFDTIKQALDANLSFTNRENYIEVYARARGIKTLVGHFTPHTDGIRLVFRSLC